MTKKVKTRIAFISILSIIPLLIMAKLNFLDKDLTSILMVIALILTLGFGREYIKDFGDNTKT